MNRHQFKQWLFNNLIFGENGTPVKDKQAAIASLVQPPIGKVYGIDFSHWNKPPVNFQRMKDVYQMSFAIFKMCDGSINSNYYLDHKAGAKVAGLPFGAYVWLYPSNRVNIDAQVSAWWARYSQDVPPMGLFIDCEWTYYGGVAANPNANDLRAALDKWFVKSGKQATIYTAKGYADQYLKGFAWNKEPLWIANYGVISPALPTGATTYKIHQFTSTLDGHALDPNGNAELDGNLYNGTVAQFAAEFGTVSEPPTGETTMQRYTFKSNVASETRTIRNGNGVTFTGVTSLPAGGSCVVDFIYTYSAAYTPNMASAGDKWAHIENTNNWIAVIHQGKTYGLLTALPDNAPDLSQLTVNGAVSLTVEGVSYTSGSVTLSKI